MPSDDELISAVRVEIEAASGTDNDMPSLLDISAFLHDFNRLFEITRLAVDQRYRDFEFKGPLAYREQRALSDADRFYVENLKMESPLHLILFLLALRPKETAKSVDALVRAVERLYNIRVEHRRRIAEAGEIEARARVLNAQAEEAEYRNRERRRTKPKSQGQGVSPPQLKAAPYLNRATKRLGRLRLFIKRLVVEDITTEAPVGHDGAAGGKTNKQRGILGGRLTPDELAKELEKKPAGPEDDPPKSDEGILPGW